MFEQLFEIINQYGLLIFIGVLVFSFIAGFIDAVVGGGGLIIVPYLLISYIEVPLVILFGTNKIAALAGTSISAYSFSKRVKFNQKLLVVISLVALIASFTGAKLLSHLDSEKLKPFILIILIVIAIYTFIKKDFGQIKTKEVSMQKQFVFGSILGLVVGFYDGFFGPGTGSFLVLGFIILLGFDFLNASAYSKIINCVTNVSALLVFVKDGSFILIMALLMALCNVTGSYIGTKMAIKKGNIFIRKIFLIVVCLMIAKYGYDLFLV
jgi:uncharacterized membrane protein YfcA